MKSRIGIVATAALLCISGILPYVFIGHLHVKAQIRIISPQTPIHGFPDGDLAALRDKGDLRAIRRHSWNLLEQLTQSVGPGPDKHPVWEGWYSKCAINLSQYC